MTIRLSEIQQSSRNADRDRDWLSAEVANLQP